MKNRPIKKIGNSWFIRLAQIDVKDYQLQEGQDIDLESALLLHTQKLTKEKKKQ
jgi:antitoxin component of MazEF toxin-antitoxin module